MPIHAAQNFINKLLERHRLTRPDGRPLYAYRCTENDLGELTMITGALLRATIDQAPPNRLAGALFCLFTGEWIRRRYAGGKLRYQDILAGTQTTKPAYMVLRGWIEDGLAYWQRPLLQTTQHRIFLRTLACEGGLPLSFLQQQNAALSRFFRALLASFEAYQHGAITIETLAAEAAQQYLPKSLRQDVVYTLAAQIVETVRGLRQTVAGAPNPIAALDQRDPNWRNQFPLELADEATLAFLNGLIATPLPQASTAAFEVIRSLQRIQCEPAVWHLQAELDLPGSMPIATAVHAFGAEPASRMQLLLQLGDSAPSSLAWATRNGERIRLERSRGATRYVGVEAMEAFQLVTRPRLAGQPDIAGGEALEALPWVFTSNADGEMELSFRGQGSIRTRHEAAWVAVPAGWWLQGNGAALVEPAGTLADLGREVFRVTGQAWVVSNDGNWCRIQTGAAQPEAPIYRLLGQPARGLAARIPQYLGAPKVFQIAQDGIQAVPANQLQWRPHHVPGGWGALGPNCIGDGELRILDEDGALRFRTRLGIMPKGFGVCYGPALGPQGGQMRFTAAARTIGVEDPPAGVDWRQIEAANNVEVAVDLRCLHEPPESVLVVLRWPDGAESRLTLPFPAQGVRFLDATGKVIPPNALVPCDRLSGIRVRVISHSNAAHCRLTGTLQAADLIPEMARAVWLWIRIPEVPGTDGRVRELDLLDLRDDLQTMLAASAHLDAYVRLRVEGLGGGPGPTIRVGRYDLTLERVLDDHPDQIAVQLDQVSLARIDQDGLTRMNVRMFPLWIPETEPLELKPTMTEGVPTGRWFIDRRGLAAGAWMITAREGDWNRTRPMALLLNEDTPGPAGLEVGEQHPAVPDLATAIRVQNPQQRHEAITQVVSSLVKDINSPDWELVLDLIEAFADQPASALDLLPILATHPDAVVLALLKEDAADIPDLLALLEQLPFSWRMVPIRTWLNAIRHHCDSLRIALQSLPNHDDMIWNLIQAALQAVEARYAHVQVLRELAYREVYGHFKMEGGVLIQMAQTLQGRQEILEDRLHPAHQQLIHGKDQWPQGPILCEWFNQEINNHREVASLQLPTPPGVGYRRPAQNAPIAAAMASAYGLEPHPRVVFEIASLRTFDKPWFDEAYRWSLTWMIGWLMEQDPAHWEHEQ